MVIIDKQYQATFLYMSPIFDLWPQIHCVRVHNTPSKHCVQISELMNWIELQLSAKNTPNISAITHFWGCCIDVFTSWEMCMLHHTRCILRLIDHKAIGWHLAGVGWSRLALHTWGLQVCVVSASGVVDSSTSITASSKGIVWLAFSWLYALNNGEAPRTCTHAII